MAFGANGNGQLCIGTTSSQFSPTQISLTNIFDISLGASHSLLLTSKNV